jgi:hypothetical protein
VTRIWMVDAMELDNRRLLAAHHEWHMIAGSITRGRAWQGWEAPEYRRCFIEVHRELVAEMKFRGFSHDSSPDTNIDDEFVRPLRTVQQRSYPWSEDQLYKDCWDLWCRWGGEFRGRATDPDHLDLWVRVEEDFWEVGGCHHDQGVTREGTCPCCKRASLARKGSLVLWLPTGGHVRGLPRILHVHQFAGALGLSGLPVTAGPDSPQRPGSQLPAARVRVSRVPDPLAGGQNL